MRRLALLLGCVLALAGCGGSLSGIPLQPGAAPPLLQALARDAEAGDKEAQLALGIFYEVGLFVPRDWDRAETLYARAAAGSGGTLYLYQAPIGDGPGHVLPVNLGPRLDGLPEAARRLERLRGLRRQCRDCIARGGEGEGDER